MKETGGHYPAPLRALRHPSSAKMPLDAALKVEARRSAELIVTDVSKNLIHVFRLMEGAKKAGPAGVKPARRSSASPCWAPASWAAASRSCWRIAISMSG
jgi:hypothetical protein